MSAAGASDLNVDALRVGLGAVGGTSTVEGNGLVAEDVVSWSKSSRDGSDPGVVAVDHVLGSPDLSLVVDAGLVNLDPLKGALVDSRAVTTAGSNVGEHRAEAMRPLSPLELDAAASSNGGGDSTRLGSLVAVDVGGAEGSGLNKTAVKVLGVPSGDVRERASVLLLVVVVEEETLVPLAVGDEATDDAVGSRGSGQGAEGESGRSESHRAGYARVGI